MKNDTISDFLTQIKNAYLARHKSIEIGFTKMLFEITKILEKEKFVKEVKVATEKGRKKIVITLLYPNRKPAIENLKRISKPGLRIYVGKSKIPFVYGGLGVTIVSTPLGLMTGRQARKKNVGGEIICNIW